MNNYSYISKVISSLKEQYEEHFKDELIKFMEEKNVQVKFDGDYAIFNYKVLPREIESPFSFTKDEVEDPKVLKEVKETFGKDVKIVVSEEDGRITIRIPTDYTDPIVQEARGIILDITNEDVVCWPFRKFGNWQESYADKIDWESARIVEKVDGSITKLWFDKKKNDWVWSTNGTIFAEDAPVSTSESKTFLTLIKNTLNCKDIPYNELDKNNTYIFELTGKDNKVVINYDLSELYYLGTRSNIDGKEVDESESLFKNFRKPKTYLVKDTSLKSVIELSKTLNKDGNCTNEGFVVVDKNFNRVKVKTEEYLYLHKMASISEKNIIKSLTEGINVKDLCDMVPNKSHIIMYYAYKYEEALFMADEITSYARKLYEEYSYDRKAVYESLKGLPLFDVGMKGLNNDEKGRDIFKRNVSFFKTIRNMIPPYEEPDILETKKIVLVKESLIEDASSFDNLEVEKDKEL